VRVIDNGISDVVVVVVVHYLDSLHPKKDNFFNYLDSLHPKRTNGTSPYSKAMITYWSD
jgi:hypothetical protein